MDRALGYYKGVLQNYAGFSGRARREEYWYFFLVNILVSLAFTILDTILGTDGTGTGLFSGLYSLAVLLPSLALGVRRLHDVGRSGWWLLLSFVIIIGWVVLLYWAVQDSEPGTNQYGPNPKEGVIA